MAAPSYGRLPRIRKVGCLQELPDWEARLLRAAAVFDAAHRRSAASTRAAGARLTDSYALVAASLRQAAALLHERALQVNMLHNPSRAEKHGGELVFLVRCSVCRRPCFPKQGKNLRPWRHFWQRKPCPGAKITVTETHPFHVTTDGALIPCKGYYEGCALCREEVMPTNDTGAN